MRKEIKEIVNKYLNVKNNFIFIYDFFRLENKNIKNVVESFKRKINKTNIFSFRKNGKEILFYLPYKGDDIQQTIITKSNFYEHSQLGSIKKYIPKNAVILDIGANIGNHAVYFGKILDAKKIYCFEPQKGVFKILQKNVSLNKLDFKIQLFNIGLGSKNSKAKIRFDGTKIHNCGRTSIENDSSGNIILRKLDSLKIKEKIDFIKIDTEGFEKEVLIGAKNSIERDHPLLWIEISPENEIFIFEFLEKMGYELIEKTNNFLFQIKKIYKNERKI